MSKNELTKSGFNPLIEKTTFLDQYCKTFYGWNSKKLGRVWKDLD
jgi:hypothetical protein